MGRFDRNMLPEPQGYYESRGLKLIGKGPWRTTQCEFHGGRETMRVMISSGGFICMAGCGARGGNVLDYHKAVKGLRFVEAARELGAYLEDGQPHQGREKPERIPPKDLLQVISDELHICLVVLSDYLKGKHDEKDLQRFIEAASLVLYVAGVANERSS